jgi:class 3 adenylate cyclase/HAMP domain-containing protein
MSTEALAVPARREHGPAPVRVIVCWVRRSLFRKLFLASLVLVSGALLTNGFVDLVFSYQGNQAALKRLQTKEAVAAAAGIAQFVDEIEGRVASAVRPLWGTGADGLEQRQEAYFSLLRLAPAISQVSYVDRSGNRFVGLSRVATYVPGIPADKYEIEASRLAGPDRPYRSEVYFRDGSEPHMRIGVADHDPSGGITVAEVDLTFIRDVISRIQVGRAGVAYVVDGNGRLIAYPDISPVLQQTDLSDRPQVQAARASDPVGRADRDPVSGRSLDGHDVVSYYQAVEPLGGWVFVEWPLAEAFEPLYESVVRTVLLLAIGLALSALASLALARRMVTPIRALQAGAARIGAGALERRIDVRTGDELEALADTFNRMAERLAASYTSLEQKVQERTSELAHALERQTAVSEVLRLITRSPTSRGAILDAVAENAAQLCEARGASIWLRAGNTLRRTAGYGSFASEVGAERRISRDWITGRAAAEARTVHEPDLASLSETEYAESERRFQHGHRSALSTPIKREGEVVGVISIGRPQAGGFSDRQIELLETAFADQVVIALELTRLFEEIQEQARQLAITGEERERLNRRLRLMVSPQLFEEIRNTEAEPGEHGLQHRRAEITVVFCDLRGYTAFSDRAQPERILKMLQEYHKALLPLISSHGGTLERFTGDGVMVFFNAPKSCETPEWQAVTMAMEMRDQLRELSQRWRSRRDQKLGFGVGIDQDFATVGPIGFAGRYDYTVIGSVTNCAARLCGEAGDGEVLITQAVYAAVKDLVEVELKGELTLKGFFEPVRAYNVLGLKRVTEPG